MEWMKRCMCGRIDGWMDQWMERHVQMNDRQMDEWINKLKDELQMNR